MVVMGSREDNRTTHTRLDEVQSSRVSCRSAKEEKVGRERRNPVTKFHRSLVARDNKCNDSKGDICKRTAEMTHSTNRLDHPTPPQTS